MSDMGVGVGIVGMPGPYGPSLAEIRCSRNWLFISIPLAWPALSCSPFLLRVVTHDISQAAHGSSEQTPAVNNQCAHSGMYHQISALRLLVLFTEPVVSFHCVDLVNPTHSSSSL